jgi:hypothetical protein
MNGSSYASGHSDLLGLGAAFQFVSLGSQARSNVPDNPQRDVCLNDDEPMEMVVEIEMRDAEPTARKEHTNCANVTSRIRARARDRDDFYQTTARPIRAHRSQRNHYRSHNRRQYNHNNGRSSHLYHDLNDSRGNDYRFDRPYHELSPETLCIQSEATFVSVMADSDVKEEPREDRRDGDRYRGGGNNKRRRDGEFATKCGFHVFCGTDMRRWRRQL